MKAKLSKSGKLNGKSCNQSKNMKTFDDLVKVLERIAKALEIVVDTKKKTLRMVDVERGKVYKSHLGRKLRK